MELLTQYPVEALLAGLEANEPIVSRGSGNRVVEPTAFLERIRLTASAVGIERVAELSSLAGFDFPVFQSTRPNPLHHGSLGQNTGAQGKGLDRIQAQISCIMESIEMYCAEPRVPLLVRGSFEWLRSQHVIMPPAAFFRRAGAEPARPDEPLMWTTALHLPSREPVLVPAESVYFYFTPGTYETRSIFPLGTSGLASGATYLEAVIHAIYELAERMYVALGERQEAQIDCLWEEEVDLDALRQLRNAYGSEYELQLYTTRFATGSNLPMISALLVGDEAAYVGHGCAGDLDTAIRRAVSEALQSLATVISGSREDIGRSFDATSSSHGGIATELPRFRNLRVADYRQGVHDRQFAHLREELDFLLDWLKEHGFTDLCIANLTRKGIDIPVVKVVIPGMPMERISQCEARSTGLTEVDVAGLRFPRTRGRVVGSADV
jgi:ribosomal protein S12 methylthiotransferase accessory factor